MELTMTAPGLSVFAAFGLRWGNATGPRANTPPSAETISRPADQSLIDRQARVNDRLQASEGPIIDIEARRVERPPVRSAKSQALTEKSENLQPQVASYARPARPGEAPGLRYTSASRGQLVDTWA